MNYIKDILKGALIGVANVIPGVSGGTMAVSMGIYDKIISAITNLKKNFKNSIKTLFPYIIGVVLGVVLLSFVIEKLFTYFQIPTIMAFLGLILGGLPAIIKKVENEKFKPTHLLSFALFVALIVFSTLYAATDTGATQMSFGIESILLMLILGFISAGTMVIPGVSGSMILMMLGYYETIIQTINEFIHSLLAFDISKIALSLQTLIPFGIGVILGIFIIAKIISFLLKRYPNATYWGIIGLVVASPIAILYPISFVGVGMGIWIVSFITFVAGFYFAMKLSE